MEYKSKHPEVNEVWALLKENSKQLKELRVSQKETSEQMKKTDEQMKKTDEQMKKTDEQMKKTDEQMKKTDKQIQKIGGRFNERWGTLVEALVEGKLVELFKSQGIDIVQTHTRSIIEWKDADGREHSREYDIIVANGTEVVVVEVKTTLCPRDIDYFVESLKDFKKHFSRYNSATVYGAMAYLKSENKSHILAENEGFFIIRATGDSARIVNKQGFKPKVFV